jgi:hypothetical protein
MWQEYRMDRKFTTIALAALFVSVGLAQDQPRTFYFTQPASNADMASMVTMVRTVIDIQDLSLDQDHRAMVARAPLDKLTATEWLFQQLDRSPGGLAATATEYRMVGNNDDIVQIMWLPPTATLPDLTSMVTAIRTVADLQRLFPYQARRAVVGRGSAEKVAAAEWLFHQLIPAAGDTITADSPAYPLTLDPKIPNNVMRVFRLDPGASNTTLTATITAIRTVADVQRMFPYESTKAIIVAAAAEKVAVAGWLVHQLGQPSEHTPATHETQLPGVPDGVVRVFYLFHHNSSPELTALVTELRSATQIQRLFPFSQPAAVILRGRPDQIPLAEAMIAKFGADVQ